MPEESTGSPGQPSPNDETLRRLERRIESLEYAADRENKWWRGGLIAALVLIALSILIASHHRHRRPPPGMMGPMGGMSQMGPMGGMGEMGPMGPHGMMGRDGCDGPRAMPYGPPPPPPYWGYGPDGNWGPHPGWHHPHWPPPRSEGPPPQPKE